MKVLLYNELDPEKIPNFAKMKAFLEAGDFRSAEVKKVGANLYRSKLDHTNRLLFAIHRFQGENYALVLECIERHAYEKSRFLSRGAAIDEDKIPALRELDGTPDPSLAYLNPEHQVFNLLDKIISFDREQQAVYRLQPPLIIIGSAGSGKTVLTLEKMKEALGDVLYVTRSPYLVKNSRDLYYAHNYENEDQQLDFLSFQELLESIEVPAGKECTFNAFSGWFTRFRQASGIKDAHKLFEEFKGVLTGPATDRPWLSRAEYLQLGVKQSIFAATERESVYDVFEKYLAFLRENGFYDSNLISFEYLSRVEPRYDFVVVDEVQDLTNIQLYLILKSLRRITDFIICGDSNQIVHPNFFSWSKIKTLFYREKGFEAPRELIRILHTNYRNSPQVTEIANKILKVKNCRFGSIDKESNYLVVSNGHNQGEVVFLPDADELKRELNDKTRQSTRFAVIVMHAEQKAEAQRHFNTPLVFSIQEAKGLEYENIILYNFLSADEARYREIARGVNPEDLLRDLGFARAGDKSDKSLEVYKFYINAFYVAITRAVRNLYLIEARPKQALLELLGLTEVRTCLDLASQGSSFQEWQEEARKLELQGKTEQAEQIRTRILKQKAVEWEVLSGAALENLREKAIVQGQKKAKLALFEYALVYHEQRLLNELIEVGFAPAKHPDDGVKTLNKKYYMAYELKHPGAVIAQVNKYGVDFRNPFNQTPLMIASRLGNDEVIRQLSALGAGTELINNAGFNAFQIALEQAAHDFKFASRKLPKIYHLLEPASMSVQVDHKLIKLDNHLMEFVLLNLMISFFYRRLPDNLVRRHNTFGTQDFIDAIQHFPESIIPERRKKRSYLSTILSKNEIGRDDKYNRKLFYRVKRGQYIINPKLSIRVDGEWRNIYDVLRLDLLAVDHSDFAGSNFDWKSYSVRQIEGFVRYVRQLAAPPGES